MSNEAHENASGKSNSHILKLLLLPEYKEGSKRILIFLLRILWSCLLSTVDIALLTNFWNQEPKELDSIDLPPNYRTYRVLTRNKGTPTEWLDYLPNRPPLF